MGQIGNAVSKTGKTVGNIAKNTVKGLGRGVKKVGKAAYAGVLVAPVTAYALYNGVVSTNKSTDDVADKVIGF